MRSTAWILAAMLGVAGCARDDGAPAPDAKADAPEGDAAAAPSTPTTTSRDPAGAPPSLAVGLDDALALGVLPPPPSGSTYRVDAFVPALVVAALEQSGPTWFAAYEGTPEKVGYEVEGFAVSDAALQAGFARLGLKAGDIIEEINGVPAKDPATMQRALAGSDTGVTVGVFREDYSFVLSYRFEPGLAWGRTLEAKAPMLVAAADGDDGVVPVEPDEYGAVGETPVPDPQLQPSAGGGVGPSAGGGGSPSGGGGGGGGTKKPSGGGSTPVPKPSTGGGGSGGGGTSSAVSCASGGTCTIRRAYFDSMTSSPSKLESQATIVPAIQNDVFSGYKLKWVRPGSTVQQLGFRSGDKITHVNGRDLTDDAQALALYLSLKSTSKYTIRYVRGGKNATKVVQVT